MNDIKVLVVDDEVLIAEDLMDILKGFGINSVYLAHSKNDAINALNSNRPDIALLDIRMEKELDGLELGEYINSEFKIPFMYITAHSDIAMIKEIVKTKPAAYITKPFKKSDLFANINLLTATLKNNKTKVLEIKDGYDTVIIPFENINYIESEGNYVNIYSQGKKLVSRQSLDSIMDQVDKKDFFRIHRSYIVNVSKITRYSKKEVVIKDITLPVSRTASDLFEAFMKNQ